MRLRVVLWRLAIVFAAAFASAIAAAETRPKVEIVPQLGHSKWVTEVAIAPDGKTALSGSSDKTLRLWDLASGFEIKKFEGHTHQVTSVAIAPDGKTALSGSMDRTLRFWDLASGREIKRFEELSDRGHSVAIAPDGKTALLGVGKTLKLWDLAKGREIEIFEGFADSVSSVAFAPDGKTALLGVGKMLKLWDLANGDEIKKFEGHSDVVTSVAIAPDGKTALSGSVDKTVRLWDLVSGREIKKFEGYSDVVTSVAIAPDGRTALSRSQDLTLKLWDLDSGREIKRFESHPGWVISVAIAPDGKTALSCGEDNTLRLWDLASGREIKKFEGHSGRVTSVAVAPDGKTALSGSEDNTLRLWDLASGREIKKFGDRLSGVWSAAMTPDGRTALSGGDDKTLNVWDLDSGREIKRFEGHSDAVWSVAIAPDGKTALSGSVDKTLRLWDLDSGREIKKFEGHSDKIKSVAIAPDGKTALSASWDETLRLWDLASGSEIKKIEGGFKVGKFTGALYLLHSVAIAPDGKTALSGGWNALSLWDLKSGSEIKRLLGNHTHTLDFDRSHAVAFAPDGKTALAGSADKSLSLWDLDSGRLIKKFTGRRRVYFGPTVPSDLALWFGYFDGHSASVTSVAIAPDGKTALSGSEDKTVRLWDLASGDEIKKFEGHSDVVTSVAIARNGKTALSGSEDGTIRLWDLQRGEALGSLLASREGNHLAITQNGFFTSSQRDTDMLAIVRGFEVTTIGQVHQSLYNPDLVREALAGDPNHEVEGAAKVINLDKVLDAGPPPVIAITSHDPVSYSAEDLVTVSARITDRGKGIGRIEWRLNGVTAGVMGAPAGPGPDYEVRQELALDPGDNRVEVIAYEGRNLLASRPAQTTIIYGAPEDITKPKLFMLAIGINKYVDRGGSYGRFPPLAGALSDAKAFSAEIEKAAAGPYETVRVTLALDEDATLDKLDEVVTRIASEISPRDTFVLYAAAHGYSFGGNYYMIPQDYQGGADPKALKTRAIGQEHIQEWLAERIKAKRAVILLDTCESGALTSGYAKSRTEGLVSEAAVGRLHEATGRPVLTAAAQGQLAYENYKGHGVFTYALMEALRKGDTNNNGKIEVTELAAHVQGRVPQLFAELKTNGWVVKGVTVSAARGGRGDTQSAHFGSTGEDFVIVARLP